MGLSHRLFVEIIQPFRDLSIVYSKGGFCLKRPSINSELFVQSILQSKKGTETRRDTRKCESGSILRVVNIF